MKYTIKTIIKNSLEFEIGGKIITINNLNKIYLKYSNKQLCYYNFF